MPAGSRNGSPATDATVAADFVGCETPIGGSVPPDNRSDVSGTTNEESGIDSLLYAGETRRAQLPVSNGALVATSHRLLAVTPDGDGPNLRVVQRPNAEAVGRTTSGRRFLRPAVWTLGGGTLAVAAGSVLSLQSMADAVPTVEGFGGVLAPIRTVLSLVGIVDELLLVVGALALLAGVGVVAVWLVVREPVVTVSVAGDEPLRVPAAGVTDRELRAFADDADLQYEKNLL